MSELPADIFELPVRWRADIVRDFRLRGEERCAAASPGSGFPQLLETTLEALGEAPRGPWLDLGGGLGGVGSWLQRRTGRSVILLDPARLSLRSSVDLFRELAPAQAVGTALPIRARSISAVVISGVLSLLEEVRPVLAEIDRVLIDGGLVAVADLWSDTRTTIERKPNKFWSMEDIRDVCAEHDLTVRSVGVGEPSTGWWSSASDQVDEEMRRRHDGHPAFARYEHDRCHLAAEVSSGRLLAGVMTFGRDEP